MKFLDQKYMCKYFIFSVYILLRELSDALLRSRRNVDIGAEKKKC